MIRLSAMIRLGDFLPPGEALAGLEAITSVSDLGIKVFGVALTGLEAERCVSPMIRLSTMIRLGDFERRSPGTWELKSFKEWRSPGWRRRGPSRR